MMRPVIFATVFALCAAPAMAQGSPSLAPETYTQVLNVFLSSLPNIRATMQACNAAEIAKTEPEEWEKAKAAITATLWAANFPPEVAQSPEWLMHPDVAGTAGACNASPISADATFAANTGWLQYLSYQFQQIGIPFISNPPTAESFAEVETILTEETAVSGRLIGCAAVAAPGLLIPAATDWNQRLLGALVKLAAAGYPRPRLVELADAGNPDLFIKPDDWDAALASCTEDMDWYERWSMYDVGALTRRIDDLLTRTGVTSP
jgi:hypothetical protein